MNVRIRVPFQKKGGNTYCKIVNSSFFQNSVEIVCWTHASTVLDNFGCILVLIVKFSSLLLALTKVVFITCGGLMASALDSGSNGLCSRPAGARFSKDPVT